MKKSVVGTSAGKVKRTPFEKQPPNSMILRIMEAKNVRFYFNEFLK